MLSLLVLCMCDSLHLQAFSTLTEAFVPGEIVIYAGDEVARLMDMDVVHKETSPQTALQNLN